LSDWRLNAEGQLAAGFGNAMEAAMAGRIGNVTTVNGRVPGQIAVRAGEIRRLGELFERYHKRLYGFFVRLTNQPSVSEDLVQIVSLCPLIIEDGECCSGWF